MGKDKDDEIPSVRELEALEQKDRKETAEILSGFDRPGRTPRAPRVQRDFVEHFSNPSAKPVGAPPSSRSPHRAETEPREKATVLVPRNEGMRTKLMWALAVLGMIVFGVTIAVLATPSTPPPPVSSAAPPQATMPTVTPSSATTITSAEPRAETDVETTNDTVIVAAPPSAAKKATPSPAKSVPRDDFIRDM